MKKIISNLRYKFAFLCLCLFAGAYSYAQDANSDTLTSADYHVVMPKHMDPFYSGPLRYIIMGVLIVVILFVAYRYFIDNGGHIGHTPDHQ